LPTLRKRIEAVLFVAEKAVPIETLAEVTGAAPGEIRKAIREIQTDIGERGFVLREVAGGWRFASSPDCRDDVERYLLPPKTHMSQQALETLSIIAYLQPVTKAEIESLRGVNVDGVMETLEERRLIRELGRKETVGRPILYGTSDLFLEAFGFRTVDDLPSLPDGAPRRVNGEVIQFPLKPERVAALDQIKESVEGHEDEETPRSESRLEHSVAEELARALGDTSEPVPTDL
jgi:segregation and condensation protein B